MAEFVALHVKNGQRGFAENCGHFASRGKDDKGDLYVLCDAASPAIAMAVRDRIAKLYFSQPSRSPIASLRYALENINAQLHQENAALPTRRRVAVGVACAVATGLTTYFAWVGKPSAYLLRGNRLVPATSLEYPEVAASALGRAERAEMALAPAVSAAGDVVVLCTNLPDSITDDDLRAVSEEDDPDSSADFLLELAAESGQLGTFSLLLGKPARAARTVSPPRRARAGNSHEALRKSGREAAYDEDDEEQEPEDRRSPSERRDVRSVGRGVRAQSRNRKVLLAVVLAVACVSLGILAYRWWEDRQTSVVMEQLARAEELEGKAQTSELADKRRLMAEAWTEVRQAARSRPTDSNVIAAKKRIQAQLDQLNGIVRLLEARRLFVATGGNRGRKLVADGEAVYVLDRDRGELTRFPLAKEEKTTGPEVVLRQGQGEGAVGELMDIAWVPPGGSALEGAVLVLDSNGNAYAYRGGEFAVLPLKGGNPWGRYLAAGFAGGLFLVAPEQGQIAWYPATSDGYGRWSFSYLDPDTEAKLKNAEDIAVDGDVFILASDGNIQRFYEGKAQPFVPETPDVPLRNPVGILANPPDGSVLAIDAANERIVELDHTGKFRRQYYYEGEGEVFLDMRSVSVHDGKLYVLNGRGVFELEVRK